MADNLISNLLLNFKWWVYIIQIVFFNTDVLPIILIVNYLLYFVANIIEFGLALKLYGNSLKPKEKLLFLYLPIMPIYTGFFLRIVRTYAHVMELLHKASFDDRWNPWKVSRTLKNQ